MRAQSAKRGLCELAGCAQTQTEMEKGQLKKSGAINGSLRTAATGTRIELQLPGSPGGESCARIWRRTPGRRPLWLSSNQEN